MNSSKCTQCGLVNPLTTTTCKRCNAPLNSSDNSVSHVDSEQPDINRGEASAPLLCIMCGTTDNVQVRNVKRTYTPNWIWLFLPLGILPAGIIGLIVQVQHSLMLPLCSPCEDRRKTSGCLSLLAMTACFLLILIGVGFAIHLRSWIVLLVDAAVVTAIAYFSGRHDRHAHPRYTEFSKQRVEIEAPGLGRIVVFDEANPTSVKTFG